MIDYEDDPPIEALGEPATVTDIMTRDALEVLPFNKEQAEDIMEHIMRYKEPDFSDMSYGERWVLEQVLMYLENNSGASRREVLKRFTPIESAEGA